MRSSRASARSARSTVARAAPAAGVADANLVLFRHRRIGRGMREQLVLTNHALETATVVVELRCDVDFASLFAVKERRVVPHDRTRRDIANGSLRFAEAP